MSSPTSGGAQVDVSGEGTVAYVPGGVASNLANAMDWMTRDGKTSALRAARTQWANPRFSPDGQKLAMDISDGKQRDIWVYDLVRDTLTQLTFDAGSDTNPVWTPDGKRIVFTSDRAKAGSARNLYWMSADGTGAGDTTGRKPGRAVSGVVASEWQVPRIHRESRRHRVGCHDPADGGRRGQGLETPARPPCFSARRRTRTRRCSRRMAGSSRITTPKAGGTNYRRVCASVPGSGRPVARVDQRWHLSPLVVHDAPAVVGRRGAVEGDVRAVQRRRRCIRPGKARAWSPKGFLWIADGNSYYRPPS